MPATMKRPNHVCDDQRPKAAADKLAKLRERLVTAERRHEEIRLRREVHQASERIDALVNDPAANLDNSSISEEHRQLVDEITALRGAIARQEIALAEITSKVITEVHAETEAERLNLKRALLGAVAEVERAIRAIGAHERQLAERGATLPQTTFGHLLRNSDVGAYLRLPLPDQSQRTFDVFFRGAVRYAPGLAHEISDMRA